MVAFRSLNGGGRRRRGGGRCGCCGYVGREVVGRLVVGRKVGICLMIFEMQL